MDPDTLRLMMDQFAETRRHFDIVAEGLRSDQRLLAEGITGVDERVERMHRELRGEMTDGFTELRSMIRLSYSELDRRLTWLEESMTQLQTRVEKLETSAA